jgi:hypothetical protein
MKADGLLPLVRFDLPMGDMVHVALREKCFNRDKELAIRHGSVASSHHVPTAGVTLSDFSGFRWRLDRSKGTIFIIDGAS